MQKPGFFDIFLFSLLIVLLIFGYVYTVRLNLYNRFSDSKKITIFIRDYLPGKPIKLNSPLVNSTFILTLNAAEPSLPGETKGYLIKGKITAEKNVIRKISTGKYLRFHLGDEKNILKGIIIHDE